VYLDIASASVMDPTATEPFGCIEGLRYEVLGYGLGFRTSDSGFRVEDIGSMTQNLGKGSGQRKALRVNYINGSGLRFKCWCKGEGLRYDKVVGTMLFGHIFIIFFAFQKLYIFCVPETCFSNRKRKNKKGNSNQFYFEYMLPLLILNVCHGVSVHKALEINVSENDFRADFYINKWKRNRTLWCKSLCRVRVPNSIESSRAEIFKCSALGLGSGV